MSNKEKKGMELGMKILIGLISVASIGAIVYGVFTYQTAKENEVRDNATNVPPIIEVVDNTQTTNDTQTINDTEQIVDNTLQYEEDAKELFNQHQDELICTENQFVTKYIDYRNTGLTKEQAWNTLYNEFAKEYQTQTNENGEVVAEPSEMDAVINSYDDNIEEEIAAPEENLIINFEVEPLEPTNLYAIQSVNLRQGPSANDFEKIGSLSARQQVTVVGIVKQYQGETVLWYQLDTGEFVSGAYLVANLPAETTPQQQPQPSQGNTGNTGQQGNGGFTLSFPEGTSDGFEGMDYTGPASTHEPGSLANDGINWQ